MIKQQQQQGGISLMQQQQLTQKSLESFLAWVEKPDSCSFDNCEGL